MPITLSWFDDNHSLILYTFDGTWTWEEFHRLDQPVWDLVANADYRIDLLLDLSLSSGFPLGIMDAINLAGESIISKNGGLVITIGVSSFINILFGAFRRVYPKIAEAYRVVHTFDEAIKLLERDRSETITQSISAFN